MRDVLASLLFVLGSLILVSGQDTVMSGTGTEEYTCPTYRTADIAYLEYCPTTSRTGIYSLSGAESLIGYANAPTSYKTEQGGIQISCSYNTVASITCYYYSREEGLVGDGANDSECPEPASSLPQPSPGVDYRRKRSLSKRYDQNTQYVCPFGSTSSTYYVRQTQITNGIQASNRATGVDYYYTCVINDPTTQFGRNCNYRYTDGVGLEPQQSGNHCPVTLCAAVEGSHSIDRRGTYIADDPARRRQVDTTALRRSTRGTM